MDATELKYEALKNDLAHYGKVAVAFSSGVDSSFLLKTALDVLGSNAVAVTVRHAAFPERELAEARAFCKALNVRLI